MSDVQAEVKQAAEAVAKSFVSRVADVIRAHGVKASVVSAVVGFVVNHFLKF